MDFVSTVGWQTRPWLLIALVLLTVLAMVGCGEPEDKAETTVSERTDLVVSILPQKYMVERIGGDLVKVMVLVGPGQSPVTYDPTPKQMTFLAEAEIYFQIGVPFESIFTERARTILETTRQIKTQAGIELRSVESHSHGETSSASLADPHVWLSPKLLKKQAAIIRETLSELRADQSETFSKNYAQFINELDALDAQIRTMLAPFAGDSIFVFHPSYGYFTDEYSLTQITLEPEGKEADAAHLAKLMTGLSGRKHLTLFVQPQFASGTAQTIAASVKAQVVELDPLAENCFVNLVDIATKIRMALERASAADTMRQD